MIKPPHSHRHLADGRLDLPEVTLVAASGKALPATVRALQKTLAQVRPAEAILFSDAPPRDLDLGEIRFVATSRMDDRQSYSTFILKELASHVHTEFALCVQWDGYVLNAQNWSDEFLTVDYIGAPWPHFGDGHDVGNGGFSLRSRRLLQACADSRVSGYEPEDLVICRTARPLLEREYGIRFADRDLASRFAFERTAMRGDEFGFHGVFNMARVMPVSDYRQVIASLDEGILRRSDKKELLKQAIMGCDFKSARLILNALQSKANSNISLATVAGGKPELLRPRHGEDL